jgi:hypothetical protein
MYRAEIALRLLPKNVPVYSSKPANWLFTCKKSLTFFAKRGLSPRKIRRLNNSRSTPPLHAPKRAKTGVFEAQKKKYYKRD